VTVALVRASDGVVVRKRRWETRTALDARVAYLMVSIMRDVLAAPGPLPRLHASGGGQNPNPQDGWFAGFTSALLCV